MAKRKISGKKVIGWVSTLVNVVLMVALSGLLIAGNATNVPLLKYLPLIVHQVIGYVGIGLAVVMLLKMLLPKVKILKKF